MSNIQQFSQLKADITIKLAPSLEIKVADKSSMESAKLAGKEVAHFKNLVDEKRKELVKPLNDQVKAINDYAKLIMEPVARAESHLKTELANYERVLQKEREEAQKKIEADRKAKEAALIAKAREEQERLEMEASFGISDEKDLKKQALVANAEREREEVELATMAKQDLKQNAANKVSGATRRWKFEVEDLSKVPREFLVVEDKLVRAAINAGRTEIPGFKIFQDITMSLR